MPLTLERVAFRTRMRAAAVELLTAYKEDANLTLQIYRARPATINPPTAFVDSIRERIETVGPVRRRRVPVVSIVVIHGIFDSGPAVDAGDAFIDGFSEYVLGQVHAADPNTELKLTATTDNPNYVPDWLPPDRPLRPYYATILALEGLSLD